jgi:hypothetical protein
MLNSRANKKRKAVPKNRPLCSQFLGSHEKQPKYITV